MSNDTPYPGQDEKTPDIFTRLSIAMCPQDDATRPVNPMWAGSDISFLSPAIQFSAFPLPAGQATQVKIAIDNLGTMDASPVTLETTYNIYIGNQAATMVGIQNMTIPIIPAGTSYMATVTWTPPDLFIAHACFHARVLDSYSMKHYPARCFSWDPYINPQTGSHNIILLKVTSPNDAIVVTYPVINTEAVIIQPKLLMTVIDDRKRFTDISERFPLPFVPDHLTSTGVLRRNAEYAANMYPTGAEEMGARASAGVARGESVRPAHPARLPISRRWPREEIDERFLHHRFGFDVGEALVLGDGPPVMRREVFTLTQSLAAVQLDSFLRMRLTPKEIKLVRLVIPPSEFPGPGRRKKFQVDYQVGDERPVQNLVYLYH